MNKDDRREPPAAGEQAALLRGFLDLQRDTLRWKSGGLTAEQLRTTLPPSALTIGGIMKHVALVESAWLSENLLGAEVMAPFAEIDWEATPDWEFTTAAEDSPEELHALLDRAIAESDRIIDEALADGGLDRLSIKPLRSGEHVSLSWILIHLIEEYARHNGHVDLIRESIDGLVGE